MCCVLINLAETHTVLTPSRLKAGKWSVNSSVPVPSAATHAQHITEPLCLTDEVVDSKGFLCLCVWFHHSIEIYSRSAHVSFFYAFIKCTTAIVGFLSPWILRRYVHEVFSFHLWQRNMCTYFLEDIINLLCRAAIKFFFSPPSGHRVYLVCRTTTLPEYCCKFML